VWEPAPDRPALVLVVDEYAELAEHAPEAVAAADSIARRGRTVAVTLLAATQRPTQDAMGKGAVRSQMDVRVCLRVRERRDVDLILGQGMLNAGWHAHALDAPGKFLVSAPGLDQPRRARAYLLTDEDITAAARCYEARRPTLNRPADHAYPTDTEETDVIDAEILDDDPDVILWAALRHAPPEGLTVPDLMQATGMRRTWVYDRLHEHATARNAVQGGRGRWRAAPRRVSVHRPRGRPRPARACA
jgi:S-DNA-T family DNA segregation ATPase FtsK/SpoIIIE